MCYLFDINMKKLFLSLLIIFTFLSAGAIPVIKLVSPYCLPDSGWYIRGTVSFSVSVVSSTVSKVEFYVDGKLENTDTSYPYSWLLNSRNYLIGSHTIKAIAYDSDGQASIEQSVIFAAPLTKKTTNGSSVTSGLIPDISPIITGISLCSASICLGADSAYYLTGANSENNVWYHNEGVNLWRSVDLKNWNYLGLVWSFEGDATAGDKLWTVLDNSPFRAVWSPSIFYMEEVYYISWSNPVTGPRLLKSISGKPEGPYASVILDINLTKTSIVQATGNKYSLYFNLTNVGFHFKAKNKYYLSTSTFMDNGRYSSYVGIADSLEGVYVNWHEALACGGGSSFFFDAQGNLWSTLIGNDDQAPWREKPAVVKMDIASDGKLKVAADQTFPAPLLSLLIPMAPQGLNAVAGDAQVMLNWVISMDVVSYTILQAVSAGGPYTVVASNIKKNSYLNTGLNNGTQYYYVIKGINSFGESSKSNEASATPAANTSHNQEIQISDNSVILSPNPVSGNLTIEVPVSFDDSWVLSIFNVSGKKIASQKISEVRTFYDFSSKPSGVYFVVLYNGRNTINRKIVRR
jgi:xylan 1,4-beta-xylosidase